MFKTTHHDIPYCTIVLSLLTLIYSFYVSLDLTGSLFGYIEIVKLEAYGGIIFDHLENFEIWRLFAAQMIHVKQMHMLYNVVSLFVLGLFIERHIGLVRFFLLWFVPGTIGTLISTLFVPEPWNLGTGASQAIMGISAFGLLLLYRKIDVSKGLKIAVLFSIIPALSLDLIFAHYPKPGHVVGFITGLVMGVFYLKNKTPL